MDKSVSARKNELNCQDSSGFNQWFPCGVQLVFGPSEQQRPRQDVEPLPAPFGAVVDLSFP